MISRRSIFAACASIILLVASARAARASILYLSPDLQSVAPGETVSVDLRLNSEKQVVNAVQARILYDPTALSVVRVSKADTFLTLWAEEPRVDERAGVVTLAGGTPNGSYVVNGRVVTIIFRALKLGSSAIYVDIGTSGVFLNDGLGTRTALTVVPGNVTVAASPTSLSVSSPSHPDQDAWYTSNMVQFSWTARDGAQYAYLLSTDPTAVPDTKRGVVVRDALFSNVKDGTSYFTLQELQSDGTWSAVLRRRVNVDTSAPASFTPALTRDVVPGKLALVFATTDATSSITRWRVQEGDTVTEQASSPYVLHDQRHGLSITVTAYDQAGNETSATLPAESVAAGISPWVFVGATGLILAALVVLLGVRRRLHH